MGTGDRRLFVGIAYVGGLILILLLPLTLTIALVGVALGSGSEGRSKARRFAPIVVAAWCGTLTYFGLVLLFVALGHSPVPT